MIEMLHFWQTWLAIAVMAGGMKLLDVSIGAYRNWSEDRIAARLALQRQVNEISKGVYGCHAPYIAHDFKPILSRVIRIEAAIQAAAATGSCRHSANEAAIKELQAEVRAMKQGSVRAFGAADDHYLILRNAIVNIHSRLDKLEEPKQCCAEKPAKAPPAPEAKYRAAAAPPRSSKEVSQPTTPAKKPTTTTRRSTR